LVQPDKIYNNGKNEVEVGHKQARKEEEFEVSRSSSNYKRILIVDDEPDIAISLKIVLESSNDDDDDSQKIKFDVTSYTDPVEALSDFKPNFYDLLLVDITMPIMNGFELCEKILQLDINVKVCFMTAGEINQKAIRELYPLRTIGGCFIKKPVERDHLIRQLIAELE